MAIADLILSVLAVAVSGCSVYWAQQARKANREIAAIRAERAKPRAIIPYFGPPDPEVARKLREGVVAALEKLAKEQP